MRTSLFLQEGYKPVCCYRKETWRVPPVDAFLYGPKAGAWVDGSPVNMVFRGFVQNRDDFQAQLKAYQACCNDHWSDWLLCRVSLELSCCIGKLVLHVQARLALFFCFLALCLRNLSDVGPSPSTMRCGPQLGIRVTSNSTRWTAQSSFSTEPWKS